jgi:hypothetical protein
MVHWTLIKQEIQIQTCTEVEFTCNGTSSDDDDIGPPETEVKPTLAASLSISCSAWSNA